MSRLSGYIVLLSLYVYLLLSHYQNHGKITELQKKVSELENKLNLKSEL